jgi:hypothetical protein
MRRLFLRCLDALAEGQARRELAIREHDSALAARVHGVLAILCRQCTLPDDQRRQQMVRLTISPLFNGIAAWKTAQHVYAVAHAQIRDHRELLVGEHTLVRLLFRVIAHVWPLAEDRVEYWRMLLLLGA